MDIPDNMEKIEDGTTTGELYYDSVQGIVLMISERQGKFKSVSEYMNCGQEGLEKLLKIYFDDSSLTLISCNRSAYYPEQTTILHFRVSNAPGNFDTYMIYFVHHRRRDIQLSFTYNVKDEQQSQEYIDGVMKSFHLK